MTAIELPQGCFVLKRRSMEGQPLPVVRVSCPYKVGRWDGDEGCSSHPGQGVGVSPWSDTAAEEDAEVEARSSAFDRGRGGTICWLAGGHGDQHGSCQSCPLREAKDSLKGTVALCKGQDAIYSTCKSTPRSGIVVRPIWAAPVPVDCLRRKS